MKGKKQIKQKFGRGQFAVTLVLAAALALGAWLALVLPSDLAAANEDAGHMHTFACYEGWEVNCGDETHEHTFDCYQHSDTLVCGLAEGDAHVHNNGYICEPVAKVLVCQETVHVHEDDCYKAPVQTPVQQPAQQPDDGADGNVVIEQDTNFDPNEGEFAPGASEDDGLDDAFGVAPEPGDDNQLEGETNPPNADDDNQTEGETNPPTVDDDKQTEGETNPPTAGDDKQTEGETNTPNAGDDKQTEGDNNTSNAGDDKQTEDDNNTPNAGDDKQTEDDNNTPTAGEDSQSEGDNNTPTAGEDSQSEGGDNTPAAGDDNQTEGGDSNAEGEGAPSAEADSDTSNEAPAAGDSTSFNMAHTALADTKVPMDEYPPVYCGQAAHVHGDECYVTVYECRPETEVVINVPELPVSGTVDLLAGVTVEPAVYNGQEIMVIVAEVSAVDVAGNEQEADWDGEATLNIEPGLTYSITYIACIADDSASTFGAEGVAGVLPLAEMVKTVVAEDTRPAAKIGDVKYGTLQVAIDAVTSASDEVVLLRDVQENITTKGQSFILDMAGCTLTGLGTDSVVKINGGTVSLKNGTITGGNAKNGGGVCVTKGYLSIAEDCVIKDNHATSCGGGVLIEPDAYASLDGGVITNNTSNANGGGVYVGEWAKSAKFVLNSGVISGNTAKSNGGGVYTRSGQIIVSGGTIDNNSATNGGGVYVGENKAKFSMTDGYIGTISDDTANAAGNNATLGGGIYVGDGAGAVEISGGHINGNRAENGGGVYFIRSTNNPEMHITISNVEIKGNAVTKNGGGIYALSQNWGVVDIILDNNTNITENKAVNGGGVYVDVDGKGRARKLDINKASITKNEANDGAGVYSKNNAITVNDGADISNNIASHSGGGIYVANRTLITSILDDLVINGGIISGNKANAEPSEVPVEAGTNKPIEGTEYRGSRNEGGGGIFAGCHVILNGGEISNNYAKSGGGGIYMALSDLTKNSQLTMNGGTISGNTAELNEAGGIYVGSGKNNVINKGVISDNTTNTRFDWGGGGIFVHHDATLQIFNAWIHDNTAKGFGGGVAGCPSGDVSVFSIDGASIYGNHANGGVTDRPAGVGKRQDQEAQESPVFMHDNRFQDYYCALNSYVSGAMLGNADANWVGSYGNKDGEILAVRINIGSGVSADRLMGLTAEPEKSAYNKDKDIDYASAAKGADVKIFDNISGTHGGGIMSNGILNIGTPGPKESNTQLSISANKTYEQKTEDGKTQSMSMADTQFTFKLLDKKPVIDPETGLWTLTDDTVVVSEETNNIAGGVNFTVEKAKLAELMSGETTKGFSLYMVEYPGSSDDIAYDNQVYKVDVSVAKTNEQYVVTTDKVYVMKDGDWQEVTAISFSNTYTEPIGSLQIEKQVVSGDEEGKLPAGNEAKTFVFTVVRLQADSNEPMLDKDGNKVYINENVVINYPETTQSEVLRLTPGRYMITESDSTIGNLIWSWQATGANAVTDENGNVTGYVVEVKKNATATVSVTNTYTEKKKEPEPIYIELTVKKVWEHGVNPEDSQPNKVVVSLLQDGNKMAGDEFTVELSQDNEWKTTWKGLLTDDGNGTIHTYSVSEEPVADYTAQIGTVINNEIVITNTYSKQQPGSIILSGSKSFTGRPVQSGDIFTFEIKPSQLNGGKAVPMPKNTGIALDLTQSTEFSFAPITFEQAGTYYYVIQEKRPKGADTVAGVTYDPTLYRVTVEVKANAEGALEAAITKLEKRETRSTEWQTVANDAIVFANQYSEQGVDRFFKAEKQLVNGQLAGNDFSFVLTAVGYRVAGSGAEFVVDANQPMPADASVGANGARYRIKPNGEGGFVTFNGIEFKAEHAGQDAASAIEYHYTIHEQQPTVDGTYAGQPLTGAVQNDQGQWVYDNITYDNSVKHLYVQVYLEDNSVFDEAGNEVSANKIVRAVVTEDSQREAVFTNTYNPPNPPQFGSLTIGKQVAGPAPEGAQYTFNVTLNYPDREAEVRTVTLAAGETQTIGNLPVGTTYTVAEVQPAGVSRIDYVYSDGLNAAGASNTGTISAANEEDLVTITNHYPTPDTPPGTPDNDNPGGDEPNLPDPNDPDTPDVVTIFDDDVPLTYVKVYEPETDEYVYLPEEEVPLADMEVPRTGDGSHNGWLALLSLASLLGLAVLTSRKPKQEI